MNKYKPATSGLVATKEMVIRNVVHVAVPKTAIPNIGYTARFLDNSVNLNGRMQYNNSAI